MSVSGYADYRRPLHRRNDSDELDVFEAARYFSGYNDVISAEYNAAITSQKIVCDQDNGSSGFTTTAHDLYVAPKSSHGLEKHQQMKEILKKHRQPSSPGGRLASFLNSLFSQSSSKKKKSSTKSTASSAAQSMKGDADYDVVDGWRRRRRSSISHFRSSSTTTTTADTKSLYSSSSSGFRTPPPYITTPALSKSYKDLQSYSDHKQVNLNLRSAHDTTCHKKRSMDKYRGLGKYGGTEEREQAGFRKFSDDDDDGADSDSSSDLFELQNYDLGNFYPSGLPVYETTRIESIKRGTSISNAA